MRVLVDASAAFDQGAGIGRYARNVLSNAVTHLPETQWTLLRFPERLGKAPYPFDKAKAWRKGVAKRRTFPLTRRRADQVFFRLGLPLDVRLLTGNAGIIYSPDFTAPPAGSARRIVTVHDLAFLTHPEWTPKALRQYLGRVVPDQVRRANAVAVVSEATKRDVLEHLGLPPEKVHLVGNGVEERFFDATPLTGSVRQGLRIPREYLLMVGTIEPRKNHLNVLRALVGMRSSLRLPLVIAGRLGWDYGPFMAASAPLVESGRVVLLDFVPDDLLPSLYAGASALVYPSWTEGFGLPVLEGLAAAVPVVTSTSPALREVGGAAAYFADASSHEAIAAAIETAISNVDVSRKDLGRAWARGYTWDRSGSQLAELLRAVEGSEA